MPSIKIEEEDETLFRKAMALDGFDPNARGLTTWMKAIVRKYARDLIAGKDQVDIVEAIRAAERSLSNQIDDLRKDIKARD